MIIGHLSIPSVDIFGSDSSLMQTVYNMMVLGYHCFIILPAQHLILNLVSSGDLTKISRYSNKAVGKFSTRVQPLKLTIDVCIDNLTSCILILAYPSPCKIINLLQKKHPGVFLKHSVLMNYINLHSTFKLYFHCFKVVFCVLLVLLLHVEKKSATKLLLLYCRAGHSTSLLCTEFL